MGLPETVLAPRPRKQGEWGFWLPLGARAPAPKSVRAMGDRGLGPVWLWCPPGACAPSPNLQRLLGGVLNPVSALASPGVPVPHAQTCEGYWGYGSGVSRCTAGTLQVSYILTGPCLLYFLCAKERCKRKIQFVYVRCQNRVEIVLVLLN